MEPVDGLPFNEVKTSCGTGRGKVKEDISPSRDTNTNPASSRNPKLRVLHHIQLLVLKGWSGGSLWSPFLGLWHEILQGALVSVSVRLHLLAHKADCIWKTVQAVTVCPLTEPAAHYAQYV